MSEFGASNGIRVWIDEVGFTRTEAPMPISKASTHTDALREFFQNERDEELGRWRWPENPAWVVYPDGDGVIVLNETDPGGGLGQTRTTIDRYPTSYGADAARAFFEAHPERRVWSDAEIIMWRDGAYLPQIAQHDARLGWRYSDETDARWYTETELAKLIGDADVTILIAKAAS